MNFWGRPSSPRKSPALVSAVVIGCDRYHIISELIWSLQPNVERVYDDVCGDVRHRHQATHILVPAGDSVDVTAE